jgi:hypothetical protein
VRRKSQEIVWEWIVFEENNEDIVCEEPERR